MARKTPDSALLITFLSAGGYACAYLYETSYLGHFGVPADLVDIGVRGFLAGFGALLLMQLVCVAIFVLQLFPAETPVKAVACWAVLVLFLLLGFMSWLLFAPSNSLTVTFVVSIALVAFMLVYAPRHRYKDREGSYLQKLEWLIDTRSHSLADHLTGAVGREWTLAIVVVVVGVVGSVFLGVAQSKYRELFLMSNDCVALRIYGDNLLCAKWNGALTGEFEIRPAVGVSLTKERIGPIPQYRHLDLRPVESNRSDPEPEVDVQPEAAPATAAPATPAPTPEPTQP